MDVSEPWGHLYCQDWMATLNALTFALSCGAFGVQIADGFSSNAFSLASQKVARKIGTGQSYQQEFFKSRGTVERENK